MTFWQALWEHKVKIIGVLMAVHGQLMVELAWYAQEMIISPLTLRLVGTVGTLFGVAALAAGFSNSAKVRVEEAKATTAAAMETAINSTPGIGTGPGGI